jgi:hypothetical protein
MQRLFDCAKVEQTESHMHAQTQVMVWEGQWWICPESPGVEVVRGEKWLPGELVESPDDVAGLTSQGLRSSVSVVAKEIQEKAVRNEAWTVG